MNNSVREYAGAFAVLIGLIVVLLVAIRGFRPRSGLGNRTSSAHSTGYLRRYHPRNRASTALTAMPLGWALGETFSPTSSSLIIAMFLGALGGAALSLSQIGAYMSQMVGAMGLLISIKRVADLGSWEGQHRVILVACAIVVGVSSVVASVFIPPSRTWGLIAVMIGLKLAIFGIGLQGGDYSNISTKTLLVLAVICLVGVPALSSVAPTVVLPLFALGLVTVKAMTDLGFLDGRVDTSVGFVIAASLGAVGFRWLTGAEPRNT